MKRYLYLFPLMAFTAATLTLAACDDKKKEEEQAVAEQSQTTTETTVAEAAPDAVAPVMNAEGATSFATAEGATNGAIFLTLHNPQAVSDKLVGATTDKAATVEIHESYVDETTGTMQMRRVDGVDVPAGQQVSLKADGYHIMLMGLTAPLVQGETFNVTLKFQNAPEVTVPVTVTAPGDASATDATAATTGTDATTSTTTDPTASEAVTTPADETSSTTEEDVTPAPTEAPATDTSTETTTDAPAADEQPAQ